MRQRRLPQLACNRRVLPFKHALLCACSLKLKLRREWEAWRKSGKRPATVHSAPECVYEHDGWQGWGHWLGTGDVVVKKDHQFLTFKKALLCARSLKPKRVKRWEAWCKSGARKANMPSTQHKPYKHDGWQGHGHWLGTDDLVGGIQDFLPFKKALRHTRFLKLERVQEWEAWCKSGVRKANMPTHPNAAYTHDGWQGYGHWLGTGNLVGGKLDFLPFKKVLLHARSLKLKTQKAWQTWCKSDSRPANMPSSANAVYKHNGWQGYGHWLGTGNAKNGNQQFLLHLPYHTNTMPL